MYKKLSKAIYNRTFENYDEVEEFLCEFGFKYCERDRLCIYAWGNVKAIGKICIQLSRGDIYFYIIN